MEARFREDMGQIQEYAKRCIHCGFCNAACPTSNVSSSYKESRTSRGRVIMLQSLAEGRGRLDPYDPGFKALIDLCYSCRRCVETCPAGIPIPDLMARARHAYLMEAGPAALTLGHRIFGNYGTFDRLGSMLAPLSNFALRRHAVRVVMEWGTHIDARAPLPRFSRESFESWFRKQPVAEREKKAVYFVDSYSNFNDPSIGKTVVRLLSHLGYQVIVPPQKESGMPAVEYGMHDKATALARYNVSQLLPYAERGIPIVCSSPAALYLLREGYGTVLEDRNLASVSKAAVDITELLDDEYHRGNLKFEDETPMRAIYHYCCLSKALSSGATTIGLLRAAGVQCRMVEECCGGAGVWGTFKENYEISAEVAAKLRGKLESGTVVLTESETCRLQIEGRIGSTVRFPLELLARRVRWSSDE